MKVLLPLVALTYCVSAMDASRAWTTADRPVQVAKGAQDDMKQEEPREQNEAATADAIRTDYFDAVQNAGLDFAFLTPAKQAKIEKIERNLRNAKPQLDVIKRIVRNLKKLQGLDVSDDSEELGLDDGDDEEVTLISGDDENPAKFTISKQAAMMCNLVKNIIEGDETAKEIEIKNVSGPVLNLIVEYLQHHNGKVPADINKPIRDVKMKKLVEDPWDAEFINKQKKKVIFQIILGANYMDIRSLLHLGCAKIATLIKGKSPEEIKKILGDDDTPCNCLANGNDPNPGVAVDGVTRCLNCNGLLGRRRLSSEASDVAALLGLDL